MWTEEEEKVLQDSVLLYGPDPKLINQLALPKKKPCDIRRKLNALSQKTEGEF
jgi:hypothetical protein